RLIRQIDDDHNRSRGQESIKPDVVNQEMDETSGKGSDKVGDRSPKKISLPSEPERLVGFVSHDRGDQTGVDDVLRERREADADNESRKTDARRPRHELHVS